MDAAAMSTPAELPIHPAPPVRLSPYETDIRRYAMENLDCETGCPALAGQPCMWEDSRGEWHEARLLHVGRTNRARRALEDEHETEENARA
jgi:hypothetical protein